MYVKPATKISNIKTIFFKHRRNCQKIIHDENPFSESLIRFYKNILSI